MRHVKWYNDIRKRIAMFVVRRLIMCCFYHKHWPKKTLWI